MDLNEVMVILVSVYWIFFLFSVFGLLIDYGIKLKNNEDGSEGKDKINKSFRSRLFGLGFLFVIGIILSPVLISLF